MRLVGLSGYARSGKDTVGEILVRDHGFTRVSFADKLREFALAVDPIIYGWSGGLCHRLSDYVEVKGWEGAKETPEVRRLLQAIGTEAGRNILGEDVWVDAAMRGLDPEGRYVFTDVRFPNEMQAILDNGGEVWRLDRPDFGPVNDHPSETALDDVEFSRVIHNCTTLEDLEDRVFIAMAWADGDRTSWDDLKNSLPADLNG